MNKESGRSMVEMLGVLAIIGVLSAGALAGYSKAMFRHKVNQTIDIFQRVLQRVAELEENNLGDNFSIYSAQDMFNYGLLENCQETEGIAYHDHSACKLPIGILEADIYVYEPYLEGLFWVHFTDAKACTAFSSVGWDRSALPDWWNPDGYIIIAGTGNGNAHIIHEPTTNQVTSNHVSDIAEACERLCINGQCSFEFKIRDY